MWVITRTREDDLRKVYLTTIPSWTDDLENARKFDDEDRAKEIARTITRAAVEPVQ
jgi:hypothetical protein